MLAQDVEVEQAEVSPGRHVHDLLLGPVLAGGFGVVGAAVGPEGGATVGQGERGTAADGVY